MEIIMNIIIQKLFFLVIFSKPWRLILVFHDFEEDQEIIDKNCPISKEIYPFLPGAYVKMRTISESYYLQITTQASNVIALFGGSSSPLSTDMIIMGFRAPSSKHASLNSSRDRSAQMSSICRSAEQHHQMSSLYHQSYTQLSNQFLWFILIEINYIFLILHFR